MQKEFAIYALVDPRSKEWRYIGKTEQNIKTRFGSHWHNAWKVNNGKFLKNSHIYTWIRSLGGIKPEIEKIEQLETHEQVVKAEMEWIAEAKRVGCRLVNHTIGGEGTFGYKHTTETKEKLSKLRIGKTGLKGQTFDLELKLKASRRRTGLTEDQQNNIINDYLQNEDLTATDVANKYNVSSTVVFTLMRNLGYKVRTKAEQVTKIKQSNKANLINDYINGETSTNLGKKYGVHLQTVLNTLRRFGIPIRRTGPK